VEKIVRQFINNGETIRIQPLSGGLINQTYKVTIEQDAVVQNYLLQQINTHVFKSPQKIMTNIQLVNERLVHSDYPLDFFTIIQTRGGASLFKDENENYWRLCSFIEDTISYETPPSLDYVYEAAKAYGFFTLALKAVNPTLIQFTIPDFHNIQKRFELFEKSLERAKPDRLQKAKTAINQTRFSYGKFTFDFSNLPLRIVHNDAKLSNILFDKNTKKAKAVIDLDTVMPGYIITDYGDMIRGMCNSVAEDEADLSKVDFDLEKYELIKKGFLEATSEWITKEEKAKLDTGAIYIILEQAIRFLTDYLSNDAYYSTRYEAHNLDRSNNQLTLLNSMLQKITT